MAHYLVVDVRDPAKPGDYFSVEHDHSCLVVSQTVSGRASYHIDSDCVIDDIVRNAGLDVFFHHAENPQRGYSQCQVVTPGRHEIDYVVVTEPGHDVVRLGLRKV